MLAAALEWAAHNWPVFPTWGKVPAIPGAHRDRVTYGSCVEMRFVTKDPLRGKCRGGCGQLGHGVWDACCDPAVIEQRTTRLSSPTTTRSSLTTISTSRKTDGPASGLSLEVLVWADGSHDEDRLRRAACAHCPLQAERRFGRQTRRDRRAYGRRH